ncbi:Ca(2+)-dependent cysteine protease [Lobosporangium transversale]|uniref:Caspase domain-domain-containing protein n=1 Tax=Lobosporangium transversale TaxID=64571 RepID=A0A1Y2GCV0_9FUNG|nr:caspase domain-domain-containing protein [Lobosporangium transversale]KAF9897860.1 Ca(2+)-dependent cysteine protease [Lobosporangium transversale]ORZ07261.1 caspase domain-domain-containing protein [Lobosporangium transversale]|eukprot:XP_021877924.1 caspase domain-domain-containing protein [Lobosporangium transversale]
MYPGYSQQPQQPYGAPPSQYGAPPYYPPAQAYPPPAQPYPASSPYPPPAHHPPGPYPPPAPSPYQQSAPPTPYGYPAPSPYGAPPAAPPGPPAPYGAPLAAHSPYGAPPAQPSAYPPPQSQPPAYPAPQAQPPAYPSHGQPPSQHMIAPSSVPMPQGGWAVQQNPHFAPSVPFQLSSCQGRKRALFIGINYFRQRNELRGCINDVKNIKTFLIRQFGFREEDCVTLTDDQRDPTRIPTKANIIAGMQWLVRDARPNDSFFFHFSGHGGQAKDLDGDEDDGYDETIYPVDHEVAGTIRDDTMHQIMVRQLPAGCRLTAIMDCCHSGSALDLPFIYSTKGQLKESNMLSDVGSGVLNAGLSYLRGDIGGALHSFGGIGKKITQNPKKRQENMMKKASPADCIMFSGCKDTQTSADAHEQGFGMTGAMTFSFITTLSQNPRQTYLQLLNNIRDILRTKYSQKPQLSSSHPVDLNLMFIM